MLRRGWCACWSSKSDLVSDRASSTTSWWAAARRAAWWPASWRGHQRRRGARRAGRHAPRSTPRRLPPTATSTPSPTTRWCSSASARRSRTAASSGCSWARARGMGGSGSINGMVYTRGDARGLRQLAPRLALRRPGARLRDARAEAARAPARRHGLHRDLREQRPSRGLSPLREHERRRPVGRDRLRDHELRGRRAAQLVRRVREGRRWPRQPARAARVR